LPAEFVLFGEDASRAVVSCDPGKLARIQSLADEYGLSADLLGETGGERVEIRLDGTPVASVPVSELNDVYEGALQEALRAEPAAATGD